MANNRLNLFCVICGGTFMLAKYFPGEAYFAPEKVEPLEDRLNTWLREHAHGLQYGNFGPDQYAIAYEVEQCHGCTL